MAESGAIINLSDYRDTHASEMGSPVRDGEMLHFKRLATSRVGVPVDEDKATETKLEDLYGGDTPTGGVIARARQLLAEMAGRANNAQDCLSADDLMGADQEVNLIQADLPELFCCRDLSEGLAAVTLALHYSLVNRHEATLTSDQLYAIRVCLEKIFESPFISFESGLDFIDSFQTAGLVTDPPEAKQLSDIFVTAAKSSS